MKRLFWIAVLSVAILPLFGIRNWKTFTNTTHLYDMTEHEGKLYLATWGGLVRIDLATNQIERTWTNVDGLPSQDIRSLAVVTDKDEVLVGTASGGILRLHDEDFDIPLNSVTVLLSDNVNRVLCSGTRIYAATDRGLNVIEYSPSFPYPYSIYGFNAGNGLSEDIVLDLALTDDGYLVVAHEQSIDYIPVDQLYLDTSWRTRTMEDMGLDEDAKINSVAARGPKVAIASTNGMVVYNNFPGAFSSTVYTRTNHLAYESVNPVFIDSQQNLWFSYGYWDRQKMMPVIPLPMAQRDTMIYAVKMTPGGQFTKYRRDAGLLTPNAMRYGEIGGKVCLSTWGEGGFFLQPDETWTQVKTNSIVANTVTCMATDDDGIVWIGNGFIGMKMSARGTRGVSGYDPGTDQWINFTAKDSGLHSDNIYSVTVDSDNRKWFGSWGGSDSLSWQHGIGIYDNSPGAEQTWSYLNTSTDPLLLNNTISALSCDRDGKTGDPGSVWIGSYGGNLCGWNIADQDADVVHNFQLPWVTLTDQHPVSVFFGIDGIFFGDYHNGLRIWDGADLPAMTSSGWLNIPIPDLLGQSGYVHLYGVQYRHDYFGDEYWIASDKGLFVWDTQNWYRLGTIFKREIWDDGWLTHTRYFTDEQKLFGGIATFPTAIFIDPFDRVWIGSDGNGITMYDGTTERYTNYNMDNAPLLSNSIVCFSYEPVSGYLFIGTSEGLNAVEIGSTAKVPGELNNVIAFPNPFRPEMHQTLTIANKGGDGPTPEGSYRCRIFDMAGVLVRDMAETPYYQFSWDGTNNAGKKCSSGIYFWVIFDNEGKTARGKVALIRQ